MFHVDRGFSSGTNIEKYALKQAIWTNSSTKSCLFVSWYYWASMGKSRWIPHHFAIKHSTTNYPTLVAFFFSFWIQSIMSAIVFLIWSGTERNSCTREECIGSRYGRFNVTLKTKPTKQEIQRYNNHLLSGLCLPCFVISNDRAMICTPNGVS